MQRMFRMTAAPMLALAVALAASAADAQAPKREITRIAGDLYRFQNNFHYSVFLVTPEGVIVTDPINADAASWLKAEIASRFGRPIRYLVLSHDHADHSAGGEVFDDSAVVVAHENARRTIIGERRPTAVPELTFRDRMTIALGGKSVELIWPGRSHSDNLIVMRFPEERVLFAVDLVSVNRLPYQTLSDAYIPDWIDALRIMEGLEFDILAPGHGPLGKKSDVTAHRQYFEDLHDAVLAAARAGKSLDEMKQSIRLEKYSDWGQYENWREMNIEGMYRQVTLHRRGN